MFWPGCSTARGLIPRNSRRWHTPCLVSSLRASDCSCHHPKPVRAWLVCGIGLACAVGGLALGRIHVEKRPVLYLALEDGQRRLQARSRRLMHGQPLPAGIYFMTKAKPGDVIPMITEFLDRHSGDQPLSHPRTRSGRPVHPDRQVRISTRGTTSSAPSSRTPSTPRPVHHCCVVHHTRKAESADFVDAVSGSVKA